MMSLNSFFVIINLLCYNKSNIYSILISMVNILEWNKSWREDSDVIRKSDWLMDRVTSKVWNLVSQWREDNNDNSLVEYFQKLENSLEWELKWKQIIDFKDISFSGANEPIFWIILIKANNSHWKVIDLWLPFAWWKIITQIEWQNITDCAKISINENWQPFWVVWLKDKWFQFIWDRIFKEDKTIWRTDVFYACKNKDGITIERVTIWGVWYPKFWDQVITEIEWVKIKSSYYIHSNPITWEISWEITGMDNKKYLFVGDKLIRTIWWKEIIKCINVHTQPNWTLAWGVVLKEWLVSHYLSDGVKKTYLFIWDTLIDTIWENIVEHIIEDCYCIHTQPNWTLAWRITIWNKKVPFIWNRIIYSIWWEEIEFCEELSTLPDWILTWMIKIKWAMYRFIWDTILR